MPQPGAAPLVAHQGVTVPTLWQQRVIEGRCGRCGGLMLPEWGDVAMCPTCMERKRDHDATYRAGPKGRSTVRKSSKRQKEALFAAGLCSDCRDPSEVRPDGKRRRRCIACTEIAALREAARAEARRRAARAAAIALDPHPGDTSPCVGRAGERVAS